MVKNLSIGVLGMQGAVSEHATSMTNALKETNAHGKVFFVKNEREINDIDGLIIPGGECTTISGVLYKSGLYDAISKRLKKNSLPIMGTCAGCVLLAKKIVDNTKEVKLLHAMDMQVERNAFGRQKESFEQDINIKGFSSPYHAVFIRAPIIKKVWGKCEILATTDKKVVAARQDKFLALSFHPELTSNLRIHKYFLDMI
jgi:5'-phosphate synthase pdxT subunit